ncbi:hypothetical protein FACS18949_06200 [Clostridia bacterium]|nr:hypothetical protein FACS18949_06200 [Clostridia bacterium]
MKRKRFTAIAIVFCMVLTVASLPALAAERPTKLELTNGGISIEQAAKSVGPATLAAAASSGTIINFTTSQMSTDTMGVKWSCSGSYKVGQRSNGSYYFIEVTSLTITKHYNYLIMGILGYTATCSVSPSWASISGDDTRFTISGNFHFSIVYSGTGGLSHSKTHTEYHAYDKAI